MRPNLALVFCVLWYILLRMHVCFCCVRFSFSVLSQEIGWEERLRNDLFCVDHLIVCVFALVCTSVKEALNIQHCNI